MNIRQNPFKMFCADTAALNFGWINGESNAEKQDVHCLFRHIIYKPLPLIIAESSWLLGNIYVWKLEPLL